jgi:hypothetical protein
MEKYPNSMVKRQLALHSESLVRKRVFFSLLVITPMGFLLKLYAGPGQGWLNNYAAGVLYEIFWCLVLFFFWPRRESAARIAVGVLIVTSVLEVLQLWQPGVLEQIRSTFLGRTLIGTTFSWWDFPHYVLGCALGWLWMLRVLKSRVSGQAQADG